MTLTSILRTRLAEAARHPDRGIGLPELVVSMTLVMILGTMTVLTFVQGTDSTFNSDARNSDTQQAKIATENLAKIVRLAVDPDGEGALLAFETATPTDVTFYAALGTKNSYPTADTAPKKVRIYLDSAGVIRQVVTLPVTTAGGTTWTGTTTTRIVGQNVVVGGKPLFTYLAADDTTTNATTGVAVTSLPNTSGTLTTTAARAAVESVEIWVGVRGVAAKRGAATTAVTRVTLLNL